MQILPDRERQGPVAIGLALVAVVLFYFIGIHWFVQRHLNLNEEIDGLRDQVVRFERVAAQRDQLRTRLQQLRERRQEADFFLQQADFNTAAAELTQRLKEIINTQADETDSCQVVSNQNVRSREPERFEKVVVKVRMRCNLADFVKVLYALEDGVPLVFIDNLIIYQRLNSYAVNERNRGEYRQLDIRFDMYGFLSSRPSVQEPV